MSEEQPPNSKTMRYDRQLRLWGDAGKVWRRGQMMGLGSSPAGVKFSLGLSPRWGQVPVPDTSI